MSTVIDNAFKLEGASLASIFQIRDKWRTRAIRLAEEEIGQLAATEAALKVDLSTALGHIDFGYSPPRISPLSDFKRGIRDSIEDNLGAYNFDFHLQLYELEGDVYGRIIAPRRDLIAGIMSEKGMSDFSYQDSVPGAENHIEHRKEIWDRLSERFGYLLDQGMQLWIYSTKDLLSLNFKEASAPHIPAFDQRVEKAAQEILRAQHTATLVGENSTFNDINRAYWKTADFMKTDEGRAQRSIIEKKLRNILKSELSVEDFMKKVELQKTEDGESPQPPRM